MRSSSRSVPVARAVAPGLLLAVAVAVVLAGCGAVTVGPSGLAPARSATPAPSVPSSTASVAPAATGPAPTGPLAWPADFGVEFALETYRSDPPFEIPFTLAVGERGWFSGHLHGEFFDLLRFDGLTLQDLPNRMVAFAHPAFVRGAGGNDPATGLSPEATIDGLAARPDLVSRNRSAVDLFGSPAPVVDLHADVSNTPLFGGALGNFGLGPELDVRIAAVSVDGSVLLVLVLAGADDLEAAWAQAQPMLGSVVLAGP